jgi:hypothetical protein
MRFSMPLIGLGMLALAIVNGTSQGASPYQRGSSTSHGSGFSAADRLRAEKYLAEAATLCARDGGKLWGISLCGPIAIVDPVAHSIAANEPLPAAKMPAAFGFSNSAVAWGGKRWITLMWQQMTAADEQGYVIGYLIMHELFHRIQPQLGLLLPDLNNDHLDTVEGRYWMQLEWRALEAALRGQGPSSTDALRDALAFRAARRAAFPQAAEAERTAEINEGLAEYTGIVAAMASAEERTALTIQRMKWIIEQTTFVRPFGYGSGSAYGLLLERWRSGWTREFKVTDDLPSLLMAAAHVQPSADIDAAAVRYGGAALRVAEEAREVDRRARVAEFQRQFVDGPVLIFPRAGTFTFAGDVTPLGTAGSIYPGFRAQVEWGTLEAGKILIASDGKTMRVPAPANTKGSTLSGAGWKLVLAPGWHIEPGIRTGDYRVVRGTAS